MIKNIIWDVDGTLFDTYPAFVKAFEHAIRDFGYDAPPYDWIMCQAMISIDKCIDALAERFSIPNKLLEEKFAFYYHGITAQDQPPFLGVKDICDLILSRGGKNVIVTHRRERGLIDLLETHQMKSFFSGWLTADDGFPRKPDPAAFLAMMNKHQLSPSETITVGDREIDIQAGASAGIITCLFGTEKVSPPPTLTIQKFEQLAAWLNQK